MSDVLLCDRRQAGLLDAPPNFAVQRTAGSRCSPSGRCLRALASTSLVETMEHYDPLLAPDPAEWLAAEEGRRIALVVDCHEGVRLKLPNQRLHAAIHVIVENQIAMGDVLPVRRVLDRLQREGLDRHEAIHAIGSAWAGHLSDRLSTGTRKSDADEAYWTELGRLTEEGWRRAR